MPRRRALCGPTPAPTWHCIHGSIAARRCAPVTTVGTGSVHAASRDGYSRHVPAVQGGGAARNGTRVGRSAAAGDGCAGLLLLLLLLLLLFFSKGEAPRSPPSWLQLAAPSSAGFAIVAHHERRIVRREAGEGARAVAPAAATSAGAHRHACKRGGKVNTRR